MAKINTIYDDTPIIPDAVADAVIREVECYVKQEIAIDRMALEAGLAARAEYLYQVNPGFRKHIRAKGDKGRDYLYAFMRHWLSAELHTKAPKVYKELPEDFRMGVPISECR